jgi:gas vesicle protein
MEFIVGAFVGSLAATLLVPEAVSRSLRSLASRLIRKLISARKDGAR